jgi:hypothetical protein
MTTPTPTVATCCACGTTRDLALLLRVSETGGLHRSKHVCRPGHALDGYPYCFREMVGARDLEAIETALPEAPFLPRPPSGDPPPPGGRHTIDPSPSKTALTNLTHGGHGGSTAPMPGRP